MHDALAKVWSDSHIKIEDESHLHAGHPGARTGKSHYAITVITPDFKGLTLLKRHQQVMKVLKPYFDEFMHAARLNLSDTLSPQEKTKTP